MPDLPLPKPQITKTEDGKIYLFFGEKSCYFDRDGVINFGNILKRSDSLLSLSLLSSSKSSDKPEVYSLSDLIDSLKYSDSSGTIPKDPRFILVDPDTPDKFECRAKIKEKYGNRFTLVDRNPPCKIIPQNIKPLSENNIMSK